MYRFPRDQIYNEESSRGESLDSLIEATFYDLHDQNENKSLDTTDKVVELINEFSKIDKSKLAKSLK